MTLVDYRRTAFYRHRLDSVSKTKSITKTRKMYSQMLIDDEFSTVDPSAIRVHIPDDEERSILDDPEEDEQEEEEEERPGISRKGTGG